MQDAFERAAPRFRFRTAAGAEPLTESLAFQPRPVRFIRKGKESVIRGAPFRPAGRTGRATAPPCVLRQAKDRPRQPRVHRSPAGKPGAGTDSAYNPARSVGTLADHRLQHAAHGLLCFGRLLAVFLDQFDEPSPTAVSTRIFSRNGPPCGGTDRRPDSGP